MSNKGISLALSTEVAPAKKFTVDGEEFSLLGTDHLSPESEAEAMALFARHGILQRDLDITPNVHKGTEIAERLRKCRILILTKLTTIPADTADKLPLGAQVALLEAIQEEMESATDDDGSSSSAPERQVGGETAGI